MSPVYYLAIKANKPNEWGRLIMKTRVYVELECSKSSNYLSVNGGLLEKDLQQAYDEHCDFLMKMTNLHCEIFDSFKLRYILLEVEYDGRKRKISNEDILRSLTKHGLAEKKGESMFGGFYLPTKKLQSILEDNLNKRKAFVEEGKFIKNERKVGGLL